MVWAVGVSSSGVIGTAGADGRMELSMNGKVSGHQIYNILV